MTVSGVAGPRGLTLDPATCLNASELSRFHALAGHARTDFFASRVALKDALRRSIGQPGLDLRRLSVANDLAGRPQLASHPDLRCSLAHSCGWGIGAVSDTPVGIDIERVRPRSESLLRHIADAGEVELVASCFPSDLELPVVIWTLKEAVLKGMGVGLRVPMRDVRIRRCDEGLFTLRAGTGNNWSTWSVQTTRAEDMLISIALRGRHDGPVRVNWY